MAKLTFIYSTMSGGKTLQLINLAISSEKQSKRVAIFTSEKDNRYGEIDMDSINTKVVSRAGLSKKAFLIERVNVLEYVKDFRPDLILIDEAQFLEEQQIENLIEIVDLFDIPVICYGLRSDFQLKLFRGSELLFIYADNIQEIETSCTFCERKAIAHLRFIDKKPVFKGQQILIGNENYQSVCRKCYLKYQKYYNDI